jgi:hypothetical protein
MREFYQSEAYMREEPNTVAEKIRPAIFWTGVMLVIAGVLPLLGLVMLIVEVINNPDGVALLQWLAEKVGEEGFHLHGYFVDAPFELNASPALHYIFLGIMGLFIVNILVSLVGRFIALGAQLMQFAGIQKTEKPVHRT